MCCCEKPTINGEPNYRWNNPHATPSVYPVNPPDLQDGDVLLYDEPGRCGGLDSHCHHFRVVKHTGAVYLLVRHGGGDERHRFGWGKTTMLDGLAAMDSNQRYWVLCAAHHAIKDAARDARDTANGIWQKAAAEGRIKTRKFPKRGYVKVTIEQAPAETAPWLKA